MNWPYPSSAVKLNPAALDWALNHVTQYGDTVFLPKAFEYVAIQQDWAKIKEWLLDRDMRKWKPRPYRRFLAPKGHLSYRYVTQLDPLEYLAFTAMIYQVGPQLESSRVSKQKEIVFSWRFDPKNNGQMYDPSFNWAKFNKKCIELANKKRSKWVVVTDIADFFPRIYLHPLEQAIANATSKSDEGYCIIRMIKNWNAFVSYGLPVGLAGSRILAEATIHDVDEMLKGLNQKYCRYSDDFRIFCSTESKAYETLENLASFLFETHGLTLQPSKTYILSCDEYKKGFDISPERITAESLSDKFEELMESAGIENNYDDEINYDDLSEDVRKEIDALNLEELFSEQLKKTKINPTIISFILHRLGQLNNDSILDELLENTFPLQHVMHAVVRYIKTLRGLNARSKKTIGRKVLKAVKVKKLTQYGKVCLLSIFTDSDEFDNENTFEPLLRRFNDQTLERELILALGRAKKDYWFSGNRRDIASMAPWTRRAFLAAYSCVDEDASVHFYRSLRNGQDELEKAIIKWVSANPFR